MNIEGEEIQTGEIFVYRCRKCRFNLEISDAVLESSKDDGSMKQTTIDLDPDACPWWILEAVNQSGWTKGKLNCNKCGGRLGSFDFVHERGDQHSAVHLNKDRVDVLKTTARPIANTVGGTFIGKKSTDRLKKRISSGSEKDSAPPDLNKESSDQMKLCAAISSDIQGECFDNGPVNCQDNCDVNHSADSLCENIDENQRVNPKHDEDDFKHSSQLVYHKYSTETMIPDEGDGILSTNNADSSCVRTKTYADSIRLCDGNFIPETSNNPKTGFDKVNESIKSRNLPIASDCDRTSSVIVENTNGTALLNKPESIQEIQESIQEIQESIQEMSVLKATCLDKSSGLGNRRKNLKTICDKMDASANLSRGISESTQNDWKVINFGRVCDKMDLDSSDDEDENMNINNDSVVIYDGWKAEGTDKNVADHGHADSEFSAVRESQLDQKYFQEMEYDSRMRCVRSNGEHIAAGQSTSRRSFEERGEFYVNKAGMEEEGNRFLALKNDANTDENSQNVPLESWEKRKMALKRRNAVRKKERRQRLRQRGNRFYPPHHHRIRQNIPTDDDTDYTCPPIEQLLEEEDVPNEKSCPVCLEILYSPYKCRPCNHVFCEICLRRIGSQRPNCTLCPMCRNVIKSCVSETDLGRQLCEDYPRLYKRRRTEMHRMKVAQLPLPRSSWRESTFRNVSHKMFNMLILPILFAILRPGGRRFIPSCCFCALVFGFIAILCFIVIMLKIMLRSSYEFAVNMISLPFDN